MKILVYGAGSIGCVFGGFLSKAGEDVVLLGRTGQMEAIKAKGLHIEGIWGTHDIKDMLAYSNSEHLKEDHSGSFDLILLTVKSHNTVSAMADITNITNNNTLILSLQNGFGNIEAIAKSAGEEQTLGGRIIFGAETVLPGSVKITVSADDVVIGRISQNTSNEKVEEIASLFTFAGIKTRATLEINKFIWGKALYNCALDGLASVLNAAYGQLLDSEHTKDIMRRIVAEIYLVAQKKEVELDPKTKEEFIKILFNRLVPLTSSHRPSMLQDIEKGKKTEIDFLSGAIVRMGKDIGVPTPTNQLITELIKYKEARH
ncbi:MAG: ketopantoate reductase family protein [Candidatus Margulisiibacteriota bacterium]